MSDLQNALLPAGPQAAHIHVLWQVMLIVCTIVFVAVLAALAYALVRGRRESSASRASEATAHRWIGLGIASSALLLAFLFSVTLYTDRALANLSVKDAIHIELVGHQWWWEAKYDDAQPSNVFSTANELHIPVGRPVVLTLKADDVIHSFWVPNLHGKKDLIPGRTATISIAADRPGIYRGQCAEFCGFQHAQMALLVVAESAEAFDGWLASQRQPASEPSNDLAKRGQAIVVNGTCGMCHAITGTQANAQHAPDLTHVASRQRLGAGVLPNTPAGRAAWILDAQAVKPGVNMPPQPLQTADLDAVLAYLDTLR